MANTTEYYESKICGKIEKLNQLNYLRWVTRMRHHLTATQCLSIVLGEEPCPDNARTTVYRSWMEKDGRAMGTLLGACSQEIAIHIEGSTSSCYTLLAGRRYALTPGVLSTSTYRSVPKSGHVR